MSARRTKKSPDPSVDELFVRDVSNESKPEENPPSWSAVDHIDASQTEKQLSTSRRKLGSRRKTKRQHVKDSETELHHNPKEEVEEKDGDKFLETTQPERQKELSERREHDASSFSTVTTGYSSETQSDSSNSRVNIPEILISANAKHPHEKMPNLYGLVETSQEMTDAILREEVKENTLFDSSGFISANENADENQNKQDSQPQAHFASAGEQTDESFIPLASREKPETKREPDYRGDLDVRDSAHELVCSAEAGSKNIDDNSLLQQWGISQTTDVLNQSCAKSDELNTDVQQEFSRQKDNGDQAESKRTVELVIDSSLLEMSENEKQNQPLISSEFKAAMNSEDEGEIKNIEIKESSFTPTYLESEMHDTNENYAEIETSICGHQQDAHLAIESLVEAFKPEDDHVSDLKKLQSSETERPHADIHVHEICKTEADDIKSSNNLETDEILTEPTESHETKEETSTYEEQNEFFSSAQDSGDDAKDEREEEVKIPGIKEIHQSSENVMDEATDDLEQMSNQEKEELLFDMTESKSPLESVESKTPESKVETSVLGEQNELFTSAQHSEDAAIDNCKEVKPVEIQHSSEIVIHNSNGNFETSFSNRTDQSEANDESSSKSCFRSVPQEEVSNPDDQHSESLVTTSNMAALVHTHEGDTMHPQTSETDRDTEGKEKDHDTDLLKQWGILQADNTVHGTHLNTGNTKSFNNPETTIDNTTHREHTETEYGVEREAVPSPGDEISTNEDQAAHRNAAEVSGANSSEDDAENQQEEEVTDQTKLSSAQGKQSSFQTLQQDINSPLDSKLTDTSPSVKDNDSSGLKHIRSRRKLGSSRRHKGKQHVQEISEPEESSVENIWKLPVYGLVKTDVVEPAEAYIWKDSQSISHHDPEEISQIRNIEALSCDADRAHMQQRDAVSDSETSLNPQLTTQVHVEEENKEQNEDEHDEPFSLHQNKTETGTSLDLGQEEGINIVSVSEEGGISTAADSSESQQDNQERLAGEKSENLLGSQLHIGLERQNKYEAEERESDIVVGHFVGMEELSPTEEKAQLYLRNNLDQEQEVDESSSGQQKQKSRTSEWQTTESKTLRESLGPEQSVPHVGEVQNPEPIVHGSDVRDSEGHYEVSVESTHIPGSAQAPLHGEQSAEGIDSRNDLVLKPMEAVSLVIVPAQETEKPDLPEQEMEEGAGNTKLEMKTESPNLQISPSGRRKLSSSRRIRGSRFKREDRRPVVETDATNAEDVAPGNVSGITIADEKNDSDSEPRKEMVFETVKLSHTSESQAETLEQEHDRAPDHTPESTPPPGRREFMSEPTAAGRRKMGSSRKSAGRQKDEGQTAGAEKMMDTQPGTDIRGLTNPRVSNTSEDKISEIDESEKKEKSEHLRSLCDKTSALVTPVPWTQAKVLLGQETSSDSESKHFNVLLVGDSYVGKTSFMKRAHSGKFSLDIPSSVCLDTSLWTVVLDGEPIVLQLWDTAGQERFHSLTRQVFNKAQAFLLMYDITSSQSFSAVSYWANCIQEGATEDVSILLLGNKNDHENRQVQYEDGECLAKEYNFGFMECSAATGDNVIYSLERVARMMSEKVDTQKEALVLHKAAPHQQRSGCC